MLVGVMRIMICVSATNGWKKGGSLDGRRLCTLMSTLKMRIQSTNTSDESFTLLILLLSLYA